MQLYILAQFFLTKPDGSEILFVMSGIFEGTNKKIVTHSRTNLKMKCCFAFRKN
jgi:hypothetical protein